MDHDFGELMLHLERPLHGPRALVFRMQTEADLLARWWGPTGFTVPHVDLDARVGGRYRIAMQPPGGDIFFLEGEFREIDAPARLSYTFRWDPPDADDRETVATISLRDAGPATTMIVDQGAFATEARRALHVQGWTETLDRLAALLEDGPDL